MCVKDHKRTVVWNLTWQLSCIHSWILLVATEKHLWHETQRVVNHSLFLATKNVTTILAQANNISCSIIHWVCCHNELIVVLNFCDLFNHKYAVIKDLGKSKDLLCLQILNFYAQVSLHLAPNLKNGSNNFLWLSKCFISGPLFHFPARYWPLRWVNCNFLWWYSISFSEQMQIS